MNQDMETLFIADDESSTRERLKYIIDWESLGFRLCGEASDGKNALTQILALRPSLVLLDIHMPGIQGIDVLRSARKSGFNGKCIIISKDADFTYAQEAIKSGVSFYLTKPVDKDEFYHAVCTIRDILSAEIKTTDDWAALQSNAKYSVLYDLFTNSGAAAQPREYVKAMDFLADSYQVVICEDFNNQSTIAPYTFADLLRVTNKGNTFFEQMLVENHDVVMLKGSRGRDRLSDFLEHFELYPPPWRAALWAQCF